MLALVAGRGVRGALAELQLKNNDNHNANKHHNKDNKNYIIK